MPAKNTKREMLRSAVLSEDGLYRYRLSREWDAALQRVAFVMMNPSTADAFVDDATIRKCIGFAERWGFGAIDVVNLFAYRSRDPLALLQVNDLSGPDYVKHFVQTIQAASLVIAAWGCESTLRKSRVLMQRAEDATTELTVAFGLKPVECLGRSKTGNPYHPLMLAYDTERLPYTGEVAA